MSHERTSSIPFRIKIHRHLMCFLIIAPLILLLVFLASGFYIEIRRSITSASQSDLKTKIFLFILFITVFNITFVLLLAYFNIIYFEDKKWVTIIAKINKQTFYYDEIQKVVIKNEKLIFYTGANEKG